MLDVACSCSLQEGGVLEGVVAVGNTPEMQDRLQPVHTLYRRVPSCLMSRSIRIKADGVEGKSSVAFVNPMIQRSMFCLSTWTMPPS